MSLAWKEIERRLARFETACREAGAKLTHQRLEIFREVAQTEGHPDAEEVYRGVRKRLPTVSLDTVYRTLWWLEELGLVTVLGPQRGRARFDANLESHHHFVCSHCGLMRDFACDAFDTLEPPSPLHSIGVVERIQVEAVGQCHNCAKKMKSQKVKNGGGRRIDEMK